MKHLLNSTPIVHTAAVQLLCLGLNVAPQDRQAVLWSAVPAAKTLLTAQLLCVAIWLAEQCQPSSGSCISLIALSDTALMDW